MHAIILEKVSGSGILLSVTSATAERSFSVLRCLKNYVRSTLKNDRLTSLGLVHISLRLVMTHQVRHLATSFLKSSNDKYMSA
jgi:hypothetical protein